MSERSTTADLPLLDRRAPASATPARDLTLSFEQRQKGRLRARCEDGTEVALLLERGQLLGDGTLLTGPGGEVVRVVARPEALSEMATADPLVLARAAYHLGNRHVALQIGTGWLRYQADHVLDAMLEGMGYRVRRIEAGFDPEPGAYAGGAHHHAAQHHEGHQHPVHQHAAPHHRDARVPRGGSGRDGD